LGRGTNPIVKKTKQYKTKKNIKDHIKSGIFDQPEAKVHLGQARRIEFS
jgi:hypothetical protein